MSCQILAMTMAMCRLQYLFIIGICLQLRFSYILSYKLPYNGVKIITYGEPCYSPRHLPVTIEEPVIPVRTIDTNEPALQTSCAYRPLKLNYQVTVDKSPIKTYQSEAKYPVSIQVPKVPIKSLEIVTPPLDPCRGKSYAYNTQTAPAPAAFVPISKSYNVALQVPSLPTSIPSSGIQPPEPCPVKRLTGLTSRIDKVLVPACESVPKCTCQVN